MSLYALVEQWCTVEAWRTGCAHFNLPSWFDWSHAACQRRWRLQRSPDRSRNYAAAWFNVVDSVTGADYFLEKLFTPHFEETAQQNPTPHNLLTLQKLNANKDVDCECHGFGCCAFTCLGKYSHPWLPRWQDDEVLMTSEPVRFDL